MYKDNVSGLGRGCSGSALEKSARRPCSNDACEGASVHWIPPLMIALTIHGSLLCVSSSWRLGQFELAVTLSTPTFQMTASLKPRLRPWQDFDKTEMSLRPRGGL